MCPAPLPLGALRTKRLVGRTGEREAIRTAIEAEGELRVLHIIGEGGMGKTRLLEAIPEEILPKCSNKDRCQWGGIFDLYHVDIHTNSGLEAAIIKALAPKGFTEYRVRRREYEKLRRAGGDPRRLETLREELGDLFVQGFNEITAQKRVILCFDTVELIQYESDVVQEVCGIEPSGIEVRGWLTRVVPTLKNAVVILAGRRLRPELWRDLQTNFAQTLGNPLLLQELSNKPSEKALLKAVKAAKQLETELKGLSEKETLEYFDVLEETASKKDKKTAKKLKEIKDAVKNSIYQATGGIPLRLAIVIDMLLKDIILPVHLSAITYDQIEARFVDWISKFEPEMFIALPFVAWARKGINTQLLQRLTGWDPKRCESILKTLKQFAFVKVRPGTDLIFLHDVMYDLMDRYVLTDPLQREEVCRKAIEYYDEKIQKAPAEQKPALIAEQLYYYLLADERSGYQQYTWLSEEALIGHRLDFEMGLRDELLRFFRERSRRIPDHVSRDCAVRWVKRYIAMGDYRQALNVAKSIRASEHELFKGFRLGHTQDPYFTTALLTYQGEALAYLGQDADAIKTLQQTINLLEPVLAGDDYQSWNKAHILGRAYNNLGYIYSRERRFTDALREYDKALTYFKGAGITSLEADTLKNKAMSLARQGLLLLAREFAIDAESLFRKLSMHYGEALTLNTRGLIELQTEEPREAEPLCRKALQIFTDLDDARGVGLASIGLGWALRKKGAFVPSYSEEVKKTFEEAEMLLERAIGIFREKVDEPARLMEAYAQLGLMYRDQANLYREEKAEKPEEISRLEEQAEQNLTKSIELARQCNLHLEQADCLEDLAEIYFNRGEYDKAGELLEQSDGLIPTEYQITQEKGIPSPEGADPNLWLILGKNSVLRGRMAFAQHEYKKAMEAYLLSKNYFELYSVDAMERDVRTGASRRMLKLLRGLSQETLKDLRQYTENVAAEYGISNTLGTDRTFRILDLALQAVGSGA